ncbi:MAG: ATP-binding protein [Acidobacteriota bacterium]
MFHRLSVKLILTLGGVLALIFAIFGYQLLEQHRRDLERVTFQAADRISDSIKRSILYSMQLNHREHIYHTIKIIGGEPGIKKVRIFNEIGRITFSSDENEIGTVVDKQGEACFACHSKSEPLNRLDRPDRRRIFIDEAGDRVLGLINPIENAPECYTAACHAHSPEQRILGVLDVTMTLREVDQTIVAGRRLLIIQLASAVLAVAVIWGGLIWWFVHRPVRELTAGTRRVAEGDLSWRIRVESRDEMGELGRSFNEMTDRLREAQENLRRWAETLEARVEEKTAELRKANEQMIQVERLASMGKLAAVVAHEINNPLTGILTSARLLQKKLERVSGEDYADCREHLQLIAEEAARCGEIVKHLLQFARPQTEVRRPEAVARLVHDSIRLVQHKIDLMNIQLHVEIPEELPRIICDAQAIKQVLVAVLINAAEAIGSAGGEIAVTAREDPASRMVEIAVRDNGCGMDPETMEHIFEPFFTTKEDSHGIGLGLAVVSGIVSAHNGAVEVESQVGEGTVVHIKLPSEAQRGGVSRADHEGAET